MAKNKDFDYKRAEADLEDAGYTYADEIYSYSSEKGLKGFMREHGLDEDKYFNHSDDSQNNQGGEGCFLTTACVCAEGLADDCDQLNTLRDYRDRYLKNRVGGVEDVTHYYCVAPHIVRAINDCDNSREIWHDLYHNLVLPCVDMIKAGDFEDAYALYRKTVEKLEKEYL